MKKDKNNPNEGEFDNSLLSETSVGIYYYNECPICKSQQFLDGNVNSPLATKKSSEFCGSCLIGIRKITNKKTKIIAILTVIGTLLLYAIMIYLYITKNL